MPSKSKAQHNLMAGIAHGWRPPGMKSPPPKSVAKEFLAADKGQKFCDGGAVRGKTKGTIR